MLETLTPRDRHNQTTFEKWLGRRKLRIQQSSSNAISGFLDFLGQRAVLQPMLPGLICPAAADDGGDSGRFAHGPMDQAIFIKIGDRLFVESRVLAMPFDVMNKVHKKTLIDPIKDNLFAGPRLSICLGKRSLNAAYELTSVFWELNAIYSQPHKQTSDFRLFTGAAGRN